MQPVRQTYEGGNTDKPGAKTAGRKEAGRAYWVNFHVGPLVSVSTIFTISRRGRREARPC